MFVSFFPYLTDPVSRLRHLYPSNLTLAPFFHCPRNPAKYLFTNSFHLSRCHTLYSIHSKLFPSVHQPFPFHSCPTHFIRLLVSFMSRRRCGDALLSIVNLTIESIRPLYSELSIVTTIGKTYQSCYLFHCTSVREKKTIEFFNLNSTASNGQTMAPHIKVPILSLLVMSRYYRNPIVMF